MKRVVSAISILLVAVAVCYGQTGKPVPQIPTITYLEGTVTIDGQRAAIGDTVPLGAVVETSVQSVVDIEFGTRNAIRLSENTTLVLNSLNLQTGSQLRQGSLTLCLKHLARGERGEAFLVRTPSAVCGVRGTSFFMKVESPASTYVCACNGAVQILEQDGGLLREVVASHHKGVRIADTGASPHLEDAPMLYHTDADVEAVAADIGYKINWNEVNREE